MHKAFQFIRLIIALFLYITILGFVVFGIGANYPNVATVLQRLGVLGGVAILFMLWPGGDAPKQDES